MFSTGFFLLAFLLVQEGTPLFEATGSFAVKETPQDDPFKGLDFYVVKFTSPTCRYCDFGDKTGKIAKLKETIYVEVIDVDLEENLHWQQSKTVKNPSGGEEIHLGITKLPAYWLVRKSNKWPVKKWIGNIDHSVILDELNKQN